MNDDVITFPLTILQNSNLNSNSSDNSSQIFALCNGQPVSLLGASKDSPVNVQSPEFPLNYPIDTW